jgi:hypothetical protein
MSCARIVLLCACTAAPAAAQTMTTTISGVVGANSSHGTDIDTLGLFGPTGTNLNGKTMKVTLTFASSLMEEGGQAPGYSAWSGPSGTCAVTIGGVRANPSIEKLTGIDSNRIYFYSDYQGTWELSQDAENSNEPDTCGLNVSSTRHKFVPGTALVQSFAYRPPLKERKDDNILLDITVTGVRETVTANVQSVKYSP